VSTLVKCLFAIKNLVNAVGGAEKVFCTICSELARRGHEITIMTFDPPDQNSFYLLSDNIKKIELNIGTPGTGTNPLEMVNKIFRLRQVIKEESPDITVGFMHSMFVPLSLAAFGTGIPVVGSEHITIEHYRTRPFQLVLLLLCSPLLKKITVLSESIRKKYPYPICRKMVPITNPVDLPEGRAELKENKERYTLLNVARLNEQKDQSTLIKAFHEIANEFPNWDLRIIGEGNLRSELENEIESLGLSNNVTMPGIKRNMSKEYMSADLFVVSSTYEAFGLVSAEAMSYGLPIVGFADCPGTNDLIKNGVNGFLVEKGSPRHLNLSYKLRDLMRKYSLIREYGDNSRSLISEYLDYKKILKQWENFLNNSVN
jgi:glycosyltransferase involved in cell wall biosynthesis